MRTRHDYAGAHVAAQREPPVESALQIVQHAAPGWSRALFVALLCAVLIGVFHLVTLREGHDWGDDFSMYIHHAENLADGLPYAETGYIYNPHNPSVGPRMYPPGFPLLLAPIVKVFGRDLRPMKALVVAFFVGSLIVLFGLFRAVLPPAYAATLVVVTGLNPFFWEFKDHVLSDVPFLFFSLLSLYLFRQADAPDVSKRARLALAVLAGVAAYAAYATRVLGLVLAACFIAHDLLRRKRIGWNAVLASCVFVVLACAQYVLWVHDTSYLDQLAPTAGVAVSNAIGYLRSLSELSDNGYLGAVRRGAFVASGALAALGFATSRRRDAGMLYLFPSLYLIPVILWPSEQGTRFLIPVLPFLFCYCLLGLQRVEVAVERRIGRRRIVLGGFLAAVLMSYAGRYSTLGFGPLDEGIANRESVELFEFVKASTAPGDVFLFSRPRALALYTGRSASAPYRPTDPCQLWQYLSEIRASYLITGPASDPFNADAEYLRQFVSRFRGDFREMMANRDLAVYRIERNPCVAASRVATLEARVSRSVSASE